MILARIVGTVVSTRKDARLEGKKLLIVKPISPQGDDRPVDAAIVGIVDEIMLDALHEAELAAARNK
jgi:microcompartment protein CcmK/EutM